MGGAPYKSVNKGGGALLSNSAFNHDRMPMSCLKRLDALKANNWTTITCNGTTSGFKVESWWHTTLWTAPHHCEHGVACNAHCISYIHLLWQMPSWSVKYYTKFLTSDMHSAWGCASFKLHAKLAPQSGCSLKYIHMLIRCYHDYTPCICDGIIIDSRVTVTLLSMA